MADKKYICVIDTETTGLDPKVHEIIDLCFVRLSFEPGPRWKETIEEEGRVACKTFPTNPNVDPTVAAINGYDAALWAKEAVTLPTALYNALPLMKDAYHIGSKPSFDISFIEAALERLHWQLPRLAGHHAIDMVSSFASLWFEGKIKKIGQSYVMSTLIPDEKQRHTAEEDVNNLIEMLKFL
jgi:DNA polymerase III alpha subunit (gram-positive type)